MVDQTVAFRAVRPVRSLRCCSAGVEGCEATRLGRGMLGALVGWTVSTMG